LDREAKQKAKECQILLYLTQNKHVSIINLKAESSLKGKRKKKKTTYFLYSRSVRQKEA
jgi:hypothetical protein